MKLRLYLARFLYGLQWSCGVLATLWAASPKASVERVRKHWELAAELLEFLQDWSWVASPLLMIAIPLLMGVRKYVEPPPLEHIHDVLDELRDFVFGDKEDPIHHHTATLFRATSITLNWWRPFARESRLVFVVRSGHTRQKSRTQFRIPDAADNAQGAAGRCWASNVVIPVEDLPELSKDSPAELIAEYAKKTWVDEKWVRERLGNSQSLPRSLLCVPVELGNKLWGVLVFDSRLPTLKLKRNLHQIYGIVFRCIEPHLTKLS